MTIKTAKALCMFVIVLQSIALGLNIGKLISRHERKQEIGTLYTVSAVAETRDDAVWFLDENGNEWLAWLDGSSEVAGDYTLVLWDNATPSDITDDVILEWR